METTALDSSSTLLEAATSCGTSGCGQRLHRNGKKREARPCEYHAPSHVLEYFCGHGGMAADSFVCRAADENILPVSGNDSRVVVAYLVRRILHGEFRENTTGITARTANVPTTCSGEYDKSPLSLVSLHRELCANDPGRCTVSASVNRSHAPRASLDRQTRRCSFRPGVPSILAQGPAAITRTPAKPWAISRVRSVEPSSTTMISNATSV